jgi:hypothetical protein
MPRYFRPDGFGQARSQASEIALQDARDGRMQRTRRELMGMLLAGRSVPPDVEDELLKRYVGTFSALTSRPEPTVNT